MEGYLVLFRLFRKTKFFLGIIFSPIGSIILGSVILLLIGVLVQAFIGSDIIISGLKKEKKDIDKTEKELLEEVKNEKIEEELIREIDAHLHEIEKKIDENNIIKDKK